MGYIGNINKNIFLQLDSYEAIEEQIVTEKGKTQIKIDPIYFDFDKWNIRPDAATELENIVRILKKYPEIFEKLIIKYSELIKSKMYCINQYQR